jgi:hypothetical protein
MEMASSTFGRTFEPTAATQNSGDMTGSSITVTIARPSDVNTSVRLANVGTQNVFVRLDGTAATTAAGIPMIANTVETFSMPAGSTTVKVIGASGSILYVTPGRGA